MTQPMSFDLLSRIRANPALRQGLAERCDLEISLVAPQESPWFRLSSQRAFEIVGGDASGGSYASLLEAAPDENGIFFVSSEGQAGFIARGLGELVSLVVAIPY